jgi:hypothetical protein
MKGKYDFSRGVRGKYAAGPPWPKTVHPPMHERPLRLDGEAAPGWAPPPYTGGALELMPGPHVVVEVPRNASLKALTALAMGDNDEARKMLMVCLMGEANAYMNTDQPTPMQTLRFATAAIRILKGALVKTKLLPKLPNPPWRR